MLAGGEEGMKRLIKYWSEGHHTKIKSTEKLMISIQC